MNYSSEAKRQLCEAAADGLELSLLSAIIHSCATLHRSSNGIELRLSSSNPYLSDLIERLLMQVANNCSVMKDKRDIVICGETLELLQNLSIVNIASDGAISITSGVAASLTEKDEMKRMYLRGAFLGAGSLCVSAWHLEIGVTDEKFAEDLSALITLYDLKCHVFRRKDKYIVYLKKREDICDFLALVGATKVMLGLTEKLAENKTRRDSFGKTNLELSNMERTINVGVVQAEAIRLIERTVGLSSLPDKLYEVAKLRLSDEALSYDDIAAKLGISKGSVKYRFGRIAEEAEKLKRAETILFR